MTSVTRMFGYSWFHWVLHEKALLTIMQTTTSNADYVKTYYVSNTQAFTSICHFISFTGLKLLDNVANIFDSSGVH